MAERRVPRIRFKGFEEDWEQRKLGELVERVTRKNENMESTLALTISAQYGLINQEEFFDKRIASKNIEGYFLIRKGEFAYNKSTSMDAPWGAVKRLDRYGKGVLSTLYILFRILNEQQVDSEYLVSYYCTNLWHTEVQKIAAEGARNHGLLNIAPNDFFEMKLAAPKELQEQTKIGSFLRDLDSLLSLHQRKLEKLKILKKAMLEKMFPKNGEKVPEIRFSGFADDWEQRKLGEIGTVMMCRRIFKNQTSESGEIPFYKIGTFGGVADAFITRALFEEYRLKYPFPEKGDVLISASGSIGRTVEYTGEEAYFQDSNIVWLKHDESVISTFLRNAYEVVKWSGVEGSTIKRLYNDNILRTRIKIPTISEQEKIARFLDGFDMLLSLHQRKLEKLRQIKKSMLERMFV